MLELKYEKELNEGTFVEPINRTMLELKSGEEIEGKSLTDSINRTMLELKFKGIGFHNRFLNPLIAPCWN